MERDVGRALSGPDDNSIEPTTSLLNQNDQPLIDLQLRWLEDLQYSREKALVELAEKMHEQFRDDQQKMKAELIAKFKIELDEMQGALANNYRERLTLEMFKEESKFNQTLSTIKKTQWCWYCGKEACFFCCWNTSYCSTSCQHEDWKRHRKHCRRRKQNEEEKRRANDFDDLGGSGGPSGDNNNVQALKA